MIKNTKQIGEWITSRDTGISSLTMVAIHLGAETGKFGAPHDPSDFGRCYRLLEKAPEIRESFPRIAELVPVFKPLLEQWDELCDLYRQEIGNTSGRAPLLYARIRELRKEI